LNSQKNTSNRSVCVREILFDNSTAIMNIIVNHSVGGSTSIGLTEEEAKSVNKKIEAILEARK